MRSLEGLVMISIISICHPSIHQLMSSDGRRVQLASQSVMFHLVRSFAVATNSATVETRPFSHLDPSSRWSYYSRPVALNHPRHD